MATKEEQQQRLLVWSNEYFERNEDPTVEDLQTEIERINNHPHFDLLSEEDIKELYSKSTNDRYKKNSKDVLERFMKTVNPPPSDGKITTKDVADALSIEHDEKIEPKNVLWVSKIYNPTGAETQSIMVKETELEYLVETNDNAPAYHVLDTRKK